ncbi:MAG: hypothetical protein SGILL_006032 [Bacillariaceae sp.]
MSSSGTSKGGPEAAADPNNNGNSNTAAALGNGSVAAAAAAASEDDAMDSGTDQQQQQHQLASAQPALHLTSDEVNYLIFRYMQESGFTHSAYTFVYESMLGRSNMRSSDKLIPPGALVSFLQKGLQYVGIEETLQRDQGGSGAADRKLKATTTDDAATDATNLSLLSPTTIGAITRENPPLQLNVPPATAAAAVKARLEAEAQIESDRKQAAILAAQERQSNGPPTRLIGPGSVPPQPALMANENPLNSAAAAAAALEMQAAQEAMAMSQLQQAQQQQQSSHLSPNDAAARMAQQRRAVAEMAALEEQRQAQMMQQQLHLQKRLQQERLEQLRQETLAAAQAQAVAGHPMDAAAYTAEQMGNNSNNNSVSGNKRPLSAKKGPKNKGKSSKKANTQEAEAGSSSNNAGFATLEEAVARMEQQQQTQDATMTDAPGAVAEQLLQRQLQQQNSAANNLAAARQQDELTSQQVAAVQDLMMMNGGKHNEPAQSDPPGSAAAVIAASNLPPKEAAKAADAIIEKEDELTNADPSQVLELKMHQSEVFMCAWNGVHTDIIATGSGDASARIWQMGGVKASDGLGPVRLLPHGSGPKDRKNKDVTTLEWSSDGKLLATGSYDGVARVWSLSGSLVHTLRGHKGPIFSLKWNKKGNYLLSGSYDKTTIVWNVSTANGFIEQQFHDHQAPALDVDWKDDTTFASCSTDKTVNICRVGTPRPLKTYSGHSDEVNAVKWDPSGNLLASCSDDCTAKVWEVNSDRTTPLFNFTDHQQEIYTVKW